MHKSKPPKQEIRQVINHESKCSLSRQARQRIPILINRLAALDSRSYESRLSGHAVVGLIRGSETLATAAREIDDKLRGHEAGDCAAKLLFEMEDGEERRAKIFDAADHVALVDVVLWLFIRKRVMER